MTAVSPDAPPGRVRSPRTPPLACSVLRSEAPDAGAGVDEGEEPEQGHRAEAADDHDRCADDGHADLAGLGGGSLATGVVRYVGLRSGVRRVGELGRVVDQG